MAKRLVLFHRSLKNLIRLDAFGLVLGRNRWLVAAAPTNNGPCFYSPDDLTHGLREGQEKQKDRINRSASTQASSTTASGVPWHWSRTCRRLSLFLATPQ
jgi:hypothetical protein